MMFSDGTSAIRVKLPTSNRRYQTSGQEPTIHIDDTYKRVDWVKPATLLSYILFKDDRPACVEVSGLKTGSD